MRGEGVDRELGGFRDWDFFRISDFGASEFVGLVRRQREEKRGSLARFASGPHLAAVRLHDMFYN